ncbi:sodium/potassium-transporting ATPase subunit beta-1-like isoform X2 [Ruditapes philippinarum]|nr:sodium/potassium-transporting ATPase subunit beta-1-like isoform X2 [Ruditapes philippinarum]XP_060603244.1 sodium/potassium-transporting ATPase subunit beta-1-like isoform X2 [Ruditapes philippinarum]
MGKYLNHPGLYYEPNVESDRRLIRFNTGRSSTPYEIYTKRLDSFLAGYFGENQENQTNCDNIRGYRNVSDLHSNCRFDITELGQDCVKQLDYGYKYGEPCIALHLERILNWLPEPYTIDTVPVKIRDLWTEYAVTVHCEGEDPVTKDNLGSIVLYPSDGFNFRYFPKTGLDDWQSPLVFVRLVRPNPAIALRVTCSAYAKNIKHDDMFQTENVSFDVMIN